MTACWSTCGRPATRTDFLVVCCNFTPVVRYRYRVGVPRLGWYQEIFNSDSQYYGGSNVGNYPGVHAENVGHHGRPHSMVVQLPPLGVTVFKPQRWTRHVTAATTRTASCGVRRSRFQSIWNSFSRPRVPVADDVPLFHLDQVVHFAA